MKNDRQRRRESSDSHVEVTDINNCYWALGGKTMSSSPPQMAKFYELFDYEESKKFQTGREGVWLRVDG